MPQTFKIQPVTKPCCRNCRYALSVEGSSDGLHCGVDYYRLPPVSRHVQPLKNYPKVVPTSHCDEWKSKPAE